MSTEQIRLHPSWLKRLEPEFSSPYMSALRTFILSEKAAGKKIFPKGEEYFAALNTTPFESVKVVLLGQDPYHGPGQAHGLCFSVRPDVQIPPSLVNIYKELHADLGIVPPKSGNLISWAQQGVLLLNSVLTVEAFKAASHQGRGWEQFTDAVIRSIASERQHVVFMLWGSYAQKKAAFIDRSRHFAIESVHPSPLSAYRGFLGSRPFSRANEYLQSHGIDPIDWRLR